MRLHFWFGNETIFLVLECNYISGLGMRLCFWLGMRLHFWFGNETMFLVWECDYISGLGMRLCFWFRNKTTFLVSEWDYFLVWECDRKVYWLRIHAICMLHIFIPVYMFRCHGTILTTAVGWKALWLLQGDKERAWAEAEHSIGIIICCDGHTHWGVR